MESKEDFFHLKVPHHDFSLDLFWQRGCSLFSIFNHLNHWKLCDGTQPLDVPGVLGPLWRACSTTQDPGGEPVKRWNLDGSGGLLDETTDLILRFSNLTFRKVMVDNFFQDNSKVFVPLCACFANFAVFWIAANTFYFHQRRVNPAAAWLNLWCNFGSFYQLESRTCLSLVETPWEKNRTSISIFSSMIDTLAKVKDIRSSICAVTKHQDMDGGGSLIPHTMAIYSGFSQ